ncbi:MAG: DMT family transporter, partial [Sphingobacteriia bacterium]
AHTALWRPNLLLGTTYTMGAWASVAFPPRVRPGRRMSGAAVIYLLIFSLTGGWQQFRPTGREWRQIFLITLVGSVVNQILFVAGLRYTSPANSALLYATTPLMVLLIAALWQRLEVLRLYKLLGVLISLAGVVLLLVLSGVVPSRVASAPLLGNVLTLGAVFCWSCYLAFSRPFLQRYKPWHFASATMVLSALLFVPVSLFFFPQQDFAAVPRQGWLGLASLILFNSLASYFLFLFAMQYLRASQAAIYINMQPVVAVFFSMLVLGDQPPVVFYVAAGMILCGIFLINYRQR